MIRRRSRRLPLGVEIGPGEISVVGIEMASDGFIVTDTLNEPLAAMSDEARDRVTIETLRRLADRLESQTRRCILGVAAEDVQTRVFRVAPKTRRSEAERAAYLAAEAAVAWPSHERLLALDPIPGAADSLLLSIARIDAVERLVALARAAGLDPVAVDVPLCAWRRAARDADALLDLRRERAVLLVFGRPAGYADVFAPAAADERVAALVRASLIQARRDGIADVRRIVTAGIRARCSAVEALLASDGYAAGPLFVGEHESPPWAYAYGLASWSIVAGARVA